ncbi:helix-turn-helix transcriptional regulator [Mycobacterium simiae]|uniref:Helix-turn-helix transcriptional regulator n=1 Tax=Mycobacterium simiae TaxID=1784 RepID=A0A5B1BHW0_MYCSI|nr:helix-turn-helix transcriptional regulator [Mycobacterium simiae]KAA1248218.1 helix-turn-helix transcriptional regulator [Mycobacterium simiae]
MTNHMDNVSDVEAKDDLTGEFVEEKPDPVTHELIRAEQLVKAAIEPPHVATEYFSKRFQELAASMNVRMLDTDRVRKLTPLRIQRMLKEQAPDLPVSQTQIYRYFHGEAPPRLDVVYELAKLFGVPPTYFVPEEFLPE